MASDTNGSGQDEAFPWHLGVYDAHCHPTDTMSSIESIQSMKTRVLTVMATRSQDQDLVVSAAETHGVKSPDPSHWSREECIVPCFGWHPWFSHQMYFDEDLDCKNIDNQGQGILTSDAKLAHYQSVLSPTPQISNEETRQALLSLPDPMPFSHFLAQTRAHLRHHTYALIGEVGLDRAFRIPYAWVEGDDLWSRRDPTLTPGGREGRRLTPFRCDAKHQKKILKAQLQLAAEMGRAVSLHGVAAHGLLFEALQELWKGHEKEVLSKRERKKRGQDHPSVEEEMPDTAEPEQQARPHPPRVCLHSYSGDVSNFKLYCNPKIPVQIFASFSTAINLGDKMEEETPEAFVQLIKMVPDHMLLVESDLHTAGEEIDRRMEDIVRRICRIKGWGLEEGVRQLGKNWRAFAFGET